VVDDLAFTQNIYTDEAAIEGVLQKVQELDPAGVGARSLQECLLIQLRRREPSKRIEMAEDILDRSFDQFSKKHYTKILSRHDISEEELRDAIDVIAHLNPKPGGSY
jgi:RNA polymerase sigma-54 factor